MEGGEILARYLFQSNQYTASRVVKQSAFIPFPRSETSVFRKSRMSEQEYSDSKNHISRIKGKELKAVALLNVDGIAQDLGVTIVPEESEYRWHANIVGWPAEKHEQKLIAQRLAAIARLE